MNFQEFSKICTLLKTTNSRKKKVAYIASLLKEASEEEVGIVARFLSGNIFPATKALQLNVGSSLIKEALRKRKHEKNVLSIKEVYDIFTKIASEHGRESRKRKEKLLSFLFSALPDEELSIIIGLIQKNLCQGAAEGIVLEGIGEAFGIKLEELKKAKSSLPDIGEIAETAYKNKSSLQKEAICTPFSPIPCMLAHQALDVKSAIEELGEVAFEYKLDGARLQIHKKGRKIRIFTRRLKDVTHMLNEIVNFAQNTLKEHDVIIEGEAVAELEGKVLPFQYLMRKFKKMQKEEGELKFYAFDLLWHNNTSLLHLPYIERRERLSQILPKEYIVPSIITSSVEEAEKFFKSAITLGHEGVVAKHLQSPYFAGERKKMWLKIKCAKTLDLVIVAAEWGHGRRKEWLSNYHLAAKAKESFVVVGKTFKGLKDKEFQWMTKKLLSLKLKEEEGIVYVKPKIVVEVAFDEVQCSPHYAGGLSLRFARIKRIRDDKAADEADTIEQIQEIFNKQSKYKKFYSLLH